MRDIKKIIFHCSDTADDSNITVDDIRSWHTSPDPRDPSKPWSDIGYHYVIYRNGNIMKGRNFSLVGAHCRGHNHDSIGVCLVGRIEFTRDQYKSCCNLIAMFSAIYPGIEYYGHKDFDAGKTCPNFEVANLKKLAEYD